MRNIGSPLLCASDSNLRHVEYYGDNAETETAESELWRRLSLKRNFGLCPACAGFNVDELFDFRNFVWGYERSFLESGIFWQNINLEKSIHAEYKEYFGEPRFRWHFKIDCSKPKCPMCEVLYKIGSGMRDANGSTSFVITLNEKTVPGTSARYKSKDYHQSMLKVRLMLSRC